MALISSIDGANRKIYLSSNTVDASIHPIDIYKEMRTLRANNEELRKFDLFMRADGNVPKSSSTFTERYVILLEGTLIVPYDTTHTLTITGTIITDDGKEGVYCFDRSGLSSQVDINYIPPQVEVIVIHGGSGLSTDEHDKLMALPESVWDVNL